MQIIKSIKEWQSISKTIQNNVGFVPTMGNLHAGHSSLIEASIKQNAITIVSIFVNLTQFDNKDDFDNYPKTLESDVKILEELKVDYLFLPDMQEIYADNFAFQITNNSEISQIMEGKYRPGHFNGMLTIVMKLLLIIKPTNCYLGEKDYQQLALIKSLVESFFLNINIIACKTIRNEDLLPLSSRNNRLSVAQLKKAALFSQLLQSNFNDDEVLNQLTEKGFKVDYIEIYDNRRFGAVHLDNVRLIDNIKL